MAGFAAGEDGVLMTPTIYHGTPLTPRAALNAVLPGRASCVSFFHPYDAEAVAAVCPYVMFRQRRIFGMESRHETRRGMVSARGLDALLPVAGNPLVSSRQMGGDTGRSGGAVAAQ